MFKKICLNTVAFLILFSSNLMAEEAVPKAVGVGDHLIAGTFKTLARVYVTTIDLEKIKTTQIHLLEGMPPEKFKKHFDKAEVVVSSLPPSFQSKYGFKKEMTKEEVIAEIKKLDKKRINEMIEETPDSFIAFQFKKYLNDLKQDAKENDWAKKVHEFWESVIPKGEK